ncbi:MAG TPA: flagellum-specific ATP synthase FliI, partial [Leptospiraceae bacterium]|nr:flagellum-specific ATP synthase FliI [Leptospiraceae bacterium]
RVMQTVVGEDHFMYAGFVRELISTYNTSEELILLNAYVKGANPKVDMAIDKKEAIDQFLIQKIETRASYLESLRKLKELFQTPEEDY